MSKRRTQLAVLTAVLTLGASAPALADFVRLGSVDVGYRMDRDATWSRFGGRMEGLHVRAGGSDIYCRNIVVTYGNGERQNVFRGMLPQDNPVNIDVRGGARHVSQIVFTCRSDRFRGGKIYVAADVGRFRDEWQRSPAWASYWSHVFNWGGPSAPGYDDADVNQWVSLGRERFVGGRDEESSFTGWRGRSIDRIALRAVDGDARCTRVRVQFANGASSEISAGHLYHMDQSRMYGLDLPGGDRDVRRLDLLCRGLGQRSVTIEIFARK